MADASMNVQASGGIASSSTERDIRDQKTWRLWLDLLPTDDREMFDKATMHYINAEDTLLLVFPFHCQAVMGADGFSRVVDAIRSFYDANRQRWMVELASLEQPGEPPRQAVMPRVIIEIAPPRERSH